MLPIRSPRSSWNQRSIDAIASWRTSLGSSMAMRPMLGAIEVRIEHRHLGDPVDRQLVALGDGADRLRRRAVVDAEGLGLLRVDVRVDPGHAVHRVVGDDLAREPGAGVGLGDREAIGEGAFDEIAGHEDSFDVDAARESDRGVTIGKAAPWRAGGATHFSAARYPFFASTPSRRAAATASMRESTASLARIDSRWCSPVRAE